MTTYAIGDIQGCYEPLMRLLDAIDFDQARDQLWFCGDLVNRGGQSLAVLRFVKSLGDSAVTVLGNHDLHLLAQWYRDIYDRKPNEEFDEIFDAPDAAELMHWLQRRPLLHHDDELGFAMIHAGLAPQWDFETAKSCAAELEAFLGSDDSARFYSHMYGNEPAAWAPNQKDMIRLRTITNALTRMRFCQTDGKMDFKYKGPPGSQPTDLLPWYQAHSHHWPYRIVFGHWSALGYFTDERYFCLDSGCVWGGPLTALTLEQKLRTIQVDGL